MKSLYQSVYDALYSALQEGDYLKSYTITKEYYLKNYYNPDYEDTNEPYWERSVELHTTRKPDGCVEIFTVCWDRREHRYRVMNLAELFSGEVDILSACATEISKWIANETPEVAAGALDAIFQEIDE